MNTIEEILENAWETRDSLTNENASLDVRESVAEAIDLLDSGSARVAEPVGKTWRVNQWLKKAVLLSFRLAENTQIEGGYTHYFDKVPSKFDGFSEQQFNELTMKISNIKENPTSTFKFYLIKIINKFNIFFIFLFC